MEKKMTNIAHIVKQPTFWPAVLLGLETQREDLINRIESTRALLKERTEAAHPSSGQPRRVLSAKAKKKISEVTKKRWAAYRAAKEAAANPRKMSPKGKASVSNAQKASWAAARQFAEQH